MHATVNGLSLSERHGFHLSPTSYHPGRTRGLCDLACGRHSRSCLQLPGNYGQYDQSYCNCSSFASRNVLNRCHPQGSCGQCDQFCCNCSSSSQAPVETPLYNESVKVLEACKIAIRSYLLKVFSIFLFFFFLHKNGESFEILVHLPLYLFKKERSKMVKANVFSRNWYQTSQQPNNSQNRGIGWFLIKVDWFF